MGGRVIFWDVATGKELRRARVDASNVSALALSPDGKILYTANGPSNDISVVDLATQTVIRRIKVRERPWGIITLSP